jgi:sulfate permease, SulP family
MPGAVSKLKFLQSLLHYKFAYLKFDIAAALTVTLLAIPQGMAYAIIAGLDPVIGLYSSMVSRVFGSLFGSSDHLVTGPTNAIALLVAGYMSSFVGEADFYATLFLLTFLIGALQFTMGVLKLGKLVNYIAHSVVVGFTAGAGIIIAMGQMNQLFGISLPSEHLSTIGKLWFTLQHLSATNYYALGLGLLTIAVIVIAKLFTKQLPGPLLAIVCSALCVYWLNLEKYGVSLVNEIPSAVPPFTLVSFSVDKIQELFTGALVIAVIGLVEAMSISKSIASQTLQKIDSDQEFIGQGTANLAGAFFSCMPASGSFTRSSVNFQSGAKTKFAGILSGFLLLVILFFFAPLIKYISNASLAGLIMAVAFSMVNVRTLKKVAYSNRNDAGIVVVTFLTTIFSPELEYAIYAGLATSIILFLRETGVARINLLLTNGQNGEKRVEFEIDAAYLAANKPPVVTVMFVGDLYFGMSADLEEKLSHIYDDLQDVILRFNHVSVIDITSLEVIENFITRALREGKNVYLYGVQPKLMSMLIRSNILGHVGEDNVLTPEDEMMGVVCESNVCYELQKLASQKKAEKYQMVKKMTNNL